jgi:hypothetical protein
MQPVQQAWWRLHPVQGPTLPHRFSCLVRAQVQQRALQQCPRLAARCTAAGSSHVSCTLAPWLTRFAASSRSHGIYMAEKEKIKDGEEYVDKLVLCEKHRPADGAKKKRRKREIKW